MNLISLLILVAGIFSIYSLNKETFPNVDFETVIVRTNYPGSSAEDVEKLVSIPIERQLKDVNGIEELNVMSGEGYSLAVLKIDPSYDMDKVKQEVRDAVEQVNDFPDEVDPPIVRKIDNKSRPILNIGLYGKEESGLRKTARKLRDKIETLKTIAKVDIEGERPLVFLIEANLDSLEQYDMSLAELTQAIKDREINLSAGSIKTSEENIVVRTFNEFQKPEDIENIVVRSNTSGASVKVKDVAKVSLTFKDWSRARRIMGKEGIILNVKSKETSDILNTTDAVKDLTKEFLIDTGVAHKFINESAFYVRRRLGVLTSNGLVGIFLVFLCLILFMNFRVSLITSIGAPLAFMVAFACMDVLGLSINLISMFGLILVLGMLVDDSIIVAENFYQHLENGMDPREAAKRSARETIAPVTATILTTMVAFGSLFFMGGIMGKFLWPVPAVVMICLAASWLECFFILPSHLADFVKIREGGIEKGKWYQPLLDFYKRNLKLALNFKFFTIGIFVSLFLVALFVGKNMRFELFPDDDVRVVFLKLKAKVGTPYEKTLQAVAEAEQAVLKAVRGEELEILTSVIGSQRSNMGSPRTGVHYGMLYVYLTTEDKRERDLDQIIAAMTEATNGVIPDGYEFTIERANTGPPKGKPINVEIMGDSLEELVPLSKKIERRIKELDGVLTTEVDFEEGKKQYLIDVKEEESRRLGVSNVTLAFELRRAFEGQVVTETRRSDEDIEVLVRLDEASRQNEETLEKLTIPNNIGRRIKLSAVADIKKSDVAYVIRRFDRKRTIAISGEIDKDKTTALEKGNEIDKMMADVLKEHPDVIYQLSGENKDTKESTMRLAKAGIISLFIIFIILVAMFGSLVQPLIVMSSIPFGLIGVVAAFFVFNLPLGFMAMMGVIGLIGVVVNDSIVLVNFINISLEKTNDAFDAIVEACISRFRPVILTTFTTVAGLLPIAHTPGGDPFLKPMAISFAYGLIFSTTLTLIFVPCCYYVYVRVLKNS